MSNSVNPQGTITTERSGVEQMERHLAELPESRQRARTRLGILLLVGLVANVGFIAWAIYVSVRSNTFGVEYVPFWWFIWATVAMLDLAIIGLMTIVTQASPPYIVGNQSHFKFGPKASREGWLTTLAGLVAAAVFAGLAIYIGATGVDLLEPFITGIVGFFVGLGLISAFLAVGRAILRSLRPG